MKTGKIVPKRIKIRGAFELPYMTIEMICPKCRNVVKNKFFLIKSIEVEEG